MPRTCRRKQRNGRDRDQGAACGDLPNNRASFQPACAMLTMSAWSGSMTGALAMSMQNVASPAIGLTPPKRNSLTHIPGDEGWPIIGKTLEVLADPKGHVERNAEKYGLVYRSHLFGETSLVLLGPEANELVFFDQAKQFSSELGWGRILGLLFPRGLMLLDFDEHRLHQIGRASC